MKFPQLNAQAWYREAVVQGRSLSPYRLRYTIEVIFISPKSNAPSLMAIGVCSRAKNLSLGSASV
ncbi:MAG: hypothetical protein LBJ00_06555 [Planctomycetaceae bacterium]|nr:hypothetical protein [Planctomycetaceae bacterium]